MLVNDGPHYVRELLEWGAAFDRDASGVPALGREAAHSACAACSMRATQPVVRSAAHYGRRSSRHPRVHVLDEAQAVALLVERDAGQRACRGAMFVDRSGTLHEAHAGRHAARHRWCWPGVPRDHQSGVATGDGIAMAFDAGARVADLEFVQFHPTALAVDGWPRFLLSEALRGEGARLVNDAGERFVQRYEPAGDLASRDLVARAIVREMQRTGAPRLPVDGPPRRRLRRGAIPDHRRRVRVKPASISPPTAYRSAPRRTTSWAASRRTCTAAPRSISLFAAGEVACTGVHGANRLASNSLLEGLVFGARAAEAMKQHRRRRGALRIAR